MSEELDKQKEILDPVQKPESNLTRTESIKTSEQNKHLTKALASNPDQFHSMQDLAIPGPNLVESFQLVDGQKTIASSRKVEQPIQNSFHDGLQALSPTATEEQKAQYQIDYIMRKSGEPGLLLKTGITETQPIIESNAEYNPIIKALQKYAHEQKERAIGSLIGTVEGIGDVAMNIAWVADFGAALILGNNERAGEMGAQLGEAVGSAIVSGVRLFSASKDYLYDVGFEGDYSKPFRDISTVASALNAQWDRLEPGEQERLKSRLITGLVADGLIGSHGARYIGKAGKYTECLEIIAKSVDSLPDSKKLKGVKAISENIKELGERSMKMTDLPPGTKCPELSQVEPELVERMAKVMRNDELVDRRELELVLPGSEMDEYFKAKNIVAMADGNQMWLRPGTSKIAAFEEYLHCTQFNHGWMGPIPREILEVKVKDFMIRHAKMIGLEQGDIDYLKLLKEQEFKRALDRGFTPYEIEGKKWLP